MKLSENQIGPMKSYDVTEALAGPMLYIRKLKHELYLKSNDSQFLPSPPLSRRRPSTPLTKKQLQVKQDQEHIDIKWNDEMEAEWEKISNILSYSVLIFYSDVHDVIRRYNVPVYVGTADEGIMQLPYTVAWKMIRNKTVETENLVTGTTRLWVVCCSTINQARAIKVGLIVNWVPVLNCLNSYRPSIGKASRVYTNCYDNHRNYIERCLDRLRSDGWPNPRHNPMLNPMLNQKQFTGSSNQQQEAV